MKMGNEKISVFYLFICLFFTAQQRWHKRATSLCIVSKFLDLAWMFHMAQPNCAKSMFACPKWENSGIGTARGKGSEYKIPA